MTLGQTVGKFKKGQGDHGRCRSSYRCCLPALAGFASPHSMGPDALILPPPTEGGKQIQDKLFADALIPR